MASDQVPHYLELFPELKTRLMKFGIGILLWNMKGLINIDNPDDVSKVHSSLKYLTRPRVMIFVSITSRWNTYAKDNGNHITEDELKSILEIANYKK